MTRRLIVALAVLAVVLGAMKGWRSYRNDQVSAEVKRRLACKVGLAPNLPPRGTPRAPEAPGGIALAPVGKVAQPVAMATREGDAGLYVAEKDGRVVRLGDGAAEVVIDLTGRVALGREQGLLGLAFSPDGRHLYTNHTDLEGDTRITEWTVGAGRADGRREVLFVDQPHRWHNGGQVAFGPDGMLYIGMGDGGAMRNLWKSGQDLGTLLGKLLRIDPKPRGGRPYTVPDDNPFVGVEGARPEIWAYGMRNPWRFSFDAATGDLWIADVGDGCYEEIDFQPAGFEGGANYGWKNAEGPWLVDGEEPPNYVEPVFSYRRDGANTCAVVGGFVYRGSALPGLQGWYVFGDFCHGQLMAWRGPDGDQPVPLGLAVSALSSFGVDPSGELYAMSLGGDVYRLQPAAG